ncbi:MAG TPA: hypothetical protein VGK80_06125 [Rhodanobacteraceae bacterium]
MKRPISLLTMLCAAGLPLSAAAFDYGPGQRLIAVEAHAPSLPDARGDSDPFEDVAAHRGHAVDDDATATPNPESGKHAAARPHTARRTATPPPATPGPGAGSPQHPPGTLSWQSLLPGSIQ